VEQGLSLALQRAAVCLEAGASVPDALLLAAQSEPGTAGTLLQSLAHELLLGSVGPAGPAGSAGALARRTGDEVAAAWETTASVVRRGQFHGTRLAAQLRSLSSDLREARRERLQQRCQRTAALTVLPLGCCLLPAFVLVSVAPLVLAFLRNLPDLA